MREVFRFLGDGYRERYLRMGVFGAAGICLTFYSDVTGAHQNTVWVHGWIFFGVALVAIGALLVLHKKGHSLAPPDPQSKPTKAGLPTLVEGCRDFALFGLMTGSQMFLIGSGQLWLGASAPQSDAPVSVFSTLIPELQKLRGEVHTVHEDLAGIDRKVGALKRETSDDPRKELANMGVLWTEEAFYNAIRQGDRRTVDLFVAGHMSTVTPDAQGRSSPIVLALNETNVGEMLDVLVGGGLDVNRAYEVSAPFGKQKMTILRRAIERGNLPLVQALIRHHVRCDDAIQTFGAMGLTRDTYPLASAVYWRHFDVADALLTAGAKPSVGDYAAYREAQALREKPGLSPEAASQLDALVDRLAPHDGSATRVHDALRLQAVERELTKVALESLKMPRGTSEKADADRRYDELQQERERLRRALGSTQ